MHKKQSQNITIYGIITARRSLVMALVMVLVILIHATTMTSQYIICVLCTRSDDFAMLIMRVGSRVSCIENNRSLLTSLSNCFEFWELNVRFYLTMGCMVDIGVIAFFAACDAFGIHVLKWEIRKESVRKDTR